MSEPVSHDLFELFEGEWECMTKVYGWNAPLLTTTRSGQFEFSVLDDAGQRVVYPGTFEVWIEDLPALGSMPAIRLHPGEGVRFPRRRSSITFYYDLERRLITDLWDAAFVKWNELHDVRDAQWGPPKGPAKTDLGPWQEVWEVTLEEYGSYFGLSVLEHAGEHQGEIATVTNEALVVVDRRGREQSRFNLPEESGPCVSWGLHTGEPYLATFGVWISPLICFDLRGSRLWRMKGKDGIDDVSPIFLDSGTTGMIVGYNADGGIEIYDPDGRIVNHITGLINVHSVSTARFSGELPNTILGIDGGSGIAFSLDREKLARYRSVAEVSDICAIDLDGDGRDEVLTLGRIYAIGANLSAFKSNGELLWSKMIEIDSDWARSPLFKITLNGVTEIAIASKTGIAFFSPAGDKTGQIAIEISDAARLPCKGVSDRLVLRGDGFVKCLEMPDPLL